MIANNKDILKKTDSIKSILNSYRPFSDCLCFSRLSKIRNKDIELRGDPK